MPGRAGTGKRPDQGPHTVLRTGFALLVMAAFAVGALPASGHLLTPEYKTPFHDHVALSYNVILDGKETQTGDGALTEFTFYAVTRLDLVPDPAAPYALYGETPTKILVSGTEKLTGERFYYNEDCPDTMTVQGTGDAVISLRLLRALDREIGENAHVLGLQVTGFDQRASLERSEKCYPPVAFFAQAMNGFERISYVDIAGMPGTLQQELTLETQRPHAIGQNVYSNNAGATKEYTETIKFRLLAATKETPSDGNGEDTKRPKAYVATVEQAAYGARIPLQGVPNGAELVIEMPAELKGETMVERILATTEGAIDEGEIQVVLADGPPSPAIPPPGQPVGYFDVELKGIAEWALYDIQLRFRTLQRYVEKSQAELVKLFTYDEKTKAWERLPTRLVDGDGEANVHEAEVEHFSSFAIVITEKEAKKGDAPAIGISIMLATLFVAVAWLRRPRDRMP